MRLVPLLALLVFVLWSSAGLAQPRCRLDLDQDGFISLEEALERPRLARMFARLDTNDDFRLDSREMKAFNDI